jgi:uncharacterized membrane protein
MSQLISRERTETMIGLKQRRALFLVAIVAIGIALVVLMIPGSHSGDNSAWVPLIPLLLVGMISPLGLLSPLAFFYAGRIPQAPALTASFQRPPPFKLA